MDVLESRSAISHETALPHLPKATDSKATPEFPFCSERCRLTGPGQLGQRKIQSESEPLIDESESETPHETTRTEHRRTMPTKTKATPRPAETASRPPRLRRQTAHGSGYRDSLLAWAIFRWRRDMGLARRAILYWVMSGYFSRPARLFPCDIASRAHVADRGQRSSPVAVAARRRVESRGSRREIFMERKIRNSSSSTKSRGSFSPICFALARSTGNIYCWVLYFFVCSIFGSHFPRGKPNRFPAAWESWRTIGSPEFTRRSGLWIARARGHVNGASANAKPSARGNLRLLD